MRARNSRSTHRSISVTRSIAPLLSTCRSPPKCAICTSPARMTDSTAVARKTGGSGSATGRQLLGHAHFHAASGGPLQHDVVHEAAHEEDAAAARLENVFRRERIGDFLRFEALALVDHAHNELARIRGRRERELHRHDLAVDLKTDGPPALQHAVEGCATARGAAGRNVRMDAAG